MSHDLVLRRPSRLLRPLAVAGTALALVAGTVANSPSAKAAVGVPISYIDQTYTSTEPPTADKPQSKLWFLDGSWWALMVGAGGSTTYIHQLMPDHTWRNTGAVVDSRPNATGDALWSSRDSRLYVASRTTGSNLQVDTFSYNASSHTWTGSTQPISSGGGSESATLDQDSTGRLWVTYTRASQVWVAHSDTNQANWTAGFRPNVLDTSIGADDLSALIAYRGYIGVMYSDQQSGGFHFAIHKDTDPDTTWGVENVTSLPGIPDAYLADDHINLKQLIDDPQGRIFAGIKTSANDPATAQPGDPLDGVLQRSADGTWSFAMGGTVGDDHTRPLLMIDATNSNLYYFATAPVHGGNIYYKVAPLSNVKALESQPGRGAKFIDVGFAVNNASGAKDPVTGATGLLVLASGSNASGVKQYVHGEMALSPGGMFDQQPADPAPTVTATSPASNATNVPVGTTVSATFSEDVQGIDGSTFTLTTSGGTAVPGTVSYIAGTRTASLVPGAPLAAGTAYTATLTTGIHDTANQPLQNYSWSFTTAAASGGDGTPPAVTARTPAAGATKVAVSVNVTATFGEAVQGVDNTTFTLKDAAGNAVAGVVSKSSTTNKWTLNPTANLASDTWYTATLTGGPSAIRDMTGTPLVTTSWQFLTGPAPTVTSKTPAAGSTGVSRTANVTVTFSEPVQAVSGTTFKLKDASGKVVTAVVSQSGTTNTWILDPSVTLAASTAYTATITGGATGVRDLAGNPLTNVTWKFTTGTV
jgi:methionine-rich copper-binding protein CopC